MLEKYNTRNPIIAEIAPPIMALLTGIEDLMVRLSDAQTENSRYAGNEQYHGMYVVFIAESMTHNNMDPTANATMPIILESNDNPTIFK